MSTFLVSSASYVKKTIRILLTHQPVLVQTCMMKKKAEVKGLGPMRGIAWAQSPDTTILIIVVVLLWFRNNAFS